MHLVHDLNMHIDRKSFKVNGREYLFSASPGYEHGTGSYKVFEGERYIDGGTYKIVRDIDTELLELVTLPSISINRIFYRQAFIPNEVIESCLVL